MSNLSLHLPWVPEPQNLNEWTIGKGEKEKEQRTIFHSLYFFFLLFFWLWYKGYFTVNSLNYKFELIFILLNSSGYCRETWFLIKKNHIGSLTLLHIFCTVFQESIFRFVFCVSMIICRDVALAGGGHCGKKLYISHLICLSKIMIFFLPNNQEGHDIILLLSHNNSVSCVCQQWGDLRLST